MKNNEAFLIIRKEESLSILKTTIPLAFKMVFHNRLYIAIAAAVFTIFWIAFNVFDQLLFFSPVVTFYLPDDAIAGFILTNITSVLMGILVAMNVYVIRNSKLKLDKSLFSGSILGIASSACASCSSIGFLVISTFGGFGIHRNRLSYKLSDPIKNCINRLYFCGHYIQYIIRLQSRAFLIHSQIINRKNNRQAS